MGQRLYGVFLLVFACLGIAYEYSLKKLEEKYKRKYREWPYNLDKNEE
jgi:hypothetical protein